MEPAVGTGIAGAAAVEADVAAFDFVSDTEALEHCRLVAAAGQRTAVVPVEAVAAWVVWAAP